MKTVTIVGATSPLGVSLVPAFAAEGWDIAAGYRDRAMVPDEWDAHTRIDPVEIDVSAGAAERNIGSEVVVWLTHLDAGRFNDAEVELNRAALLRFLDRVDAGLTRRFIFISSGGSVYGHPRSLSIEEDHPREPLSSYGLAKRVMEDEVRRYGEHTGVITAVLRPGNIYGFERPDRKCKGVTAAFLNAVDHGLPFTLVHGGHTVRDFVHVDDVCRAVLLASETDVKSVVWNVGTGVGTSTIEWLESLRAAAGAKMPNLIDKENYTSDVMENVLSYARIHEATGWKPTVSTGDGIRRTVDHWQSFRGPVSAGRSTSEL